VGHGANVGAVEREKFLAAAGNQTPITGCPAHSSSLNCSGAQTSGIKKIIFSIQ
jgi:hypothetical protein